MTVMELRNELDWLISSGQVKPTAEVVITDYEYDVQREVLGAITSDENVVELSW